MAGTISVSAEARWSASTWLFNWVVNAIASTLGPGDLAGALTGIVGENLGSLDLGEFTDQEQAAIKAVVRVSLVKLAEDKLPVNLEGRESTLTHIRDLVKLV